MDTRDNCRDSGVEDKTSKNKRGIAMFRTLCAALFLALAVAGPSRAQEGLDLRNVDLEGFVRIIAEETNRTFVLDPSVNGRVNVVGPSNVSPDALYEIFLNVLELNGLTIVEGVIDSVELLGGRFNRWLLEALPQGKKSITG